MSIFDLFDKIEKRRKESRPSGPPEWLIAGLGNPGKKYELTRHNVGFLALDTLSARAGVRVDRLKFKALTGQGAFAGRQVLFLKPQTFMNNSGEAIRDAAAYYNIPMERVLILYDDISLPPGRIRIRKKGTPGGHNGIKSIITLCGTDVFPRIKVGVGSPPHPDYSMVDWVLGAFSEEERRALVPAIDRSVKAAEVILQSGCDAAANLYNRAAESDSSCTQ